ncbi:hypothetical protein [Caballeronia sp. GAFFF2]|uniref:hypothetical protein n=1 Tax=Caballeronia sp. GAFFF2 TaxID=2921741 RepID=UPI0020278E3D|nr:hypothetical protein [Caballeronia sp. GAFFF2]
MSGAEIKFWGERAFEAVYSAEAWCAENGYSVGAAQQGAPRGLLRGDFAIAKWRNLSPAERLSLDGTMTGDMRNGPVTIHIKATGEKA